MEPLIGIDLGTTNCTVTSIDENGTKVVKNRDGVYITPSCVYFGNEENKIVVGAKAKAMSETDPANLVMFVKREMGKLKEEVRFDPLDREFKPYVYWGKTYSPEEISALILAQLKQDAEAVFGTEVKKAVITCPAYFGTKEKEATRQAGVLAGLDVLEILPEPTAAALTYCAKSEKDKETVLVFDLGGGTFDVTILNIEKNDDGSKNPKVITTEGDRQLGGMDWDKALMDYVLRQFDAKTHIDMEFEEGPEKDLALGRLQIAVERAKKQLSSQNSTEINFEYDGRSITEPISRDRFADITKRLTDKCKTYSERALNTAEMGWKDIDTILMVGSMSNCPMIQDALRDWSGKDFEFGIIDVKTCVSNGAAIKGNYIRGIKTVDTIVEKINYDMGTKTDEEAAEEVARIEEIQNKGERKQVKIADASNVISASIGIKLVDKQGNPVIVSMIKKNTAYPVSITKIFPLSRDNQTEVPLSVYEGEVKEVENCDYLGQAVLQLDSGHQKGDKVEVTFEIDQNGIIHVKGVDQKSGKSISAEIRRDGAMTQEDLDEAKKNIEEMEFFLG